MSIHDAVESGRYETTIAKLLLANSSDPDARNYKAFTPLHLAAAIGAADIVEALIDVMVHNTAPPAGEPQLTVKPD